MIFLCLILCLAVQRLIKGLCILAIRMKAMRYSYMRLIIFMLLLGGLSGCATFRKKKCDCPDLRKRKRIAQIVYPEANDSLRIFAENGYLKAFDFCA